MTAASFYLHVLATLAIFGLIVVGSKGMKW